MIPNGTIITFNVLGVIEVFIPILILFFLNRYKKYKFSSVIAGLACYFVVNYLVLNNVFALIRGLSRDDLFFTHHALLGLVLEAFIVAILLVPLARLIIQKIRGGAWSVHDTMALGVGYWMLPIFLDGAMQISTASILQRAKNHTLESLVSGDYTLEVLEELVASVTEYSTGMLLLERLVSLLAQFVILLMLLSVFVTVYYSVKRKKAGIFWAAVLTCFLLSFGINCSNYYLPLWLFFVVTLCAFAGLGFYLYRFFRFYRSQQAELIRRRKEFREEQHQKYQKELEEKYKTQS